MPFSKATVSLTVTLTRAELERSPRPIVERTRAHCLRALADAQLSPADLDEVILVGGQTRMPLVRRFVAEIFGREPNTSQNPDEAVATRRDDPGGHSHRRGAERGAARCHAAFARASRLSAA